MTDRARRWHGWELLRLGHRFTLRDRQGRARRWVLGAAATLVVVTGWLYLATGAVYDGRAARLAARTPVLVDHADPDRVFGRWLERTDTLAERQFTVVYLIPSRADAPPPPGLARWPELGEVFLSPALLAAGDGIADRYGRVEGTVGTDGLSDAGEWLAYLRPVSDDSFDIAANPTPTFVTGWGVDPSSYTAGESAGWFLGNQQHNRPASDLYLLLTLAITVPVAALVVVGTRLPAGRLNRGVAHLRARGLSRGGRVLVLAGEAALSIAAGAALGILLAATSTVVDIVLPVVGYRVPAADLVAARIWLPLLWTGAVVSVLAATILIRRGVPRRPTRSAGSARIVGAGKYLFALCLAMTAGGVVRGGAPGAAAYVVGTLGALMVLPLLAGRVGAAIAAAVGRLTGPTHPTRTAPGFRPASGPILGTVVRIGVYLTVVLYLVALADASFHPEDQIRSDNRRYAHQDSYSLVEVRGRWDDRELADFVASLPAATVLSVARAGDRNTLVGDCRSLAALGRLAACPTAMVPVDRAYHTRNAVGTALFDHAFILSPDMSVLGDGSTVPMDRLVGLIVLQPDGTGGVAAVKEVAHATVSMPLVSQPGELWVTGPAGTMRALDWVRLAGGAAFVIVLIGGTIAVMTYRQGTGRTSTATTRHPNAARSLPTAARGTLLVGAALVASTGTAQVLGAVLIDISG